MSQLSAFHAVMTSPTLTEAATRLGRTQPAVSAAIKSLEDQLGLVLFERQGRKLVPVPEAQYLLTEASAILAQVTRVRQTMRVLRDGLSGQLHLAAMPGPVSMIFPRFIAAQLGAHTDVQLSLLAYGSNQIAELARAQSIDFGFADMPDASDNEALYRTESLSADCFVALPADHALASKAEITLSDLDREPMGCLPHGHAQTRNVRAAFLAEGLQFNPKIESQTFLPILHFVQAGQCCCIMDPLTVVLANGVTDLRAALVFRPMARPLRYQYAIISPNYRPASVMARTLKEAWATEVERLLCDLGASPIWGDRS